MTDPRRALGRRGETWAVEYLASAGLQIREMNWRCDVGEIDIVATEVAPDYSTGQVSEQWLVLVEVRTRRHAPLGSAQQSIGQRKQAKLREVAKQYVAATAWQGPWRIDVVTVELQAGQPPRLVHLRHAVGDG